MLDFFKATVEQWREFLKGEKLYDLDYAYEPADNLASDVEQPSDRE